jgi:predicted MPP superfamily phosphohydrolase
VGADAFGYEAHRVLLSRHDVRVPGLPGSLDGFRIAQVSDGHFPGNQLAARAALEHLHRERPDPHGRHDRVGSGHDSGAGLRRGAPLSLVGLDDAVAGQPDLLQARHDAIAGATEIWLIHSPIFAEAPPPGVSARPVMLLAGHTHGGQIRLPLLPAVKPVGAGRFLEGWYRDTFAPLYVSRGVGTTGIPARFRCPAELPIFTLRAA